MNKQAHPSINSHQDSRSAVTIIDTDGTLGLVTGVRMILDHLGNEWTAAVVPHLRSDTRCAIRITAPNSYRAGEPERNGVLYITLTDGKRDIPVDPMPVNFVNDSGL